MSSDDIAIKVPYLGKCYQIYDNPRDRNYSVPLFFKEGCNTYPLQGGLPVE